MVPSLLGSGLHKFPWVDDATLIAKEVLTMSLAKTVLCCEEPQSARGDPVGAERYGCKPEEERL